MINVSSHEDGYYHWQELHQTRGDLYCESPCIRVPIIPPGTPLPRILDALGHTYREVSFNDLGAAKRPDPWWHEIGTGEPVDGIVIPLNPDRLPFLDVVKILTDNPAPVEARPDWTMGVPPEQWPENNKEK